MYWYTVPQKKLVQGLPVKLCSANDTFSDPGSCWTCFPHVTVTACFFAHLCVSHTFCYYSWKRPSILLCCSHIGRPTPHCEKCMQRFTRCLAICLSSLSSGQSGLTMPLSRHSVGTYLEMSPHTPCQGAFSHSRLSSLSHCGLILAQRVEIVCMSEWSNIPHNPRKQGKNHTHTHSALIILLLFFFFFFYVSLFMQVAHLFFGRWITYVTIFSSLATLATTFHLQGLT